MKFIAVLEDDPRRIALIHEAVRNSLHDFTLKVFYSAPKMIEWLSTNFNQVGLISLDYDLDSSISEDPSCGTGGDVAAYLEKSSFRTPVLIHSSNPLRGPAIHMQLFFSGFTTVRLAPFCDSATWARDVRSLLELNN